MIIKYHTCDDVIDMVVDEIEAKFGKLTRNKGNKHTFLGMDIELLPDKKTAISTPQHIEEVISDLGEKIKGDVANPAKSKLFIVNTSCKLSEKKTELFHKLVAKLLWITQRSRPDLETGVSFLCTRVQEPTEEDWTKLVRVISYLKSTRCDRRIIGADSLNSLRTFVDVSYAVHTNMRGRTGGAMTLGWGMVHARASKQKLNAKSSTETEVIGVSEYIPFKIWLTNFLEAQGYKLKDKVLHQDNMSAIRMEKNGRNSCTGNSRHISIRYFLLKTEWTRKN